MVEVMRIYEGSDGNATQALYDQLQRHGVDGVVAVNLFRACKASERAKVYRGGNQHGSWRSQAYQRKAWSMNHLCDVLVKHAAELGIGWGWGHDDRQPDYPNVLYIQIPTGQVSFHNAQRFAGPDFAGQWDGVVRQAPTRISRWVVKILKRKSEGVAA